jgi:hypothetical protein
MRQIFRQALIGLWFLGSVFTSFPVAAETRESQVVPFGHNLSSTSYLLKDGHCTLGLQVGGCGIGDEFTVGTSPWLFRDYNMLNLFLRFRVGKASLAQQDALQISYFKTYREPNAPYYEYDMEAAWLAYVRTFFLTESYTAHFNLQGMYYWNDKRPFSMRRPWMEKSLLQINLSVLNELHLIYGWFVNAEFGIIGVVQREPHFHLGMTIEYRFTRWLLHVGFSQTGTTHSYGSPLTRHDYQQTLNSTSNGFHQDYDPSQVVYDYSIHPEFALQYYF